MSKRADASTPPNQLTSPSCLAPQTHSGNKRRSESIESSSSTTSLLKMSGDTSPHSTLPTTMTTGQVDALDSIRQCLNEDNGGLLFSSPPIKKSKLESSPQVIEVLDDPEVEIIEIDQFRAAQQGVGIPTQHHRRRRDCSRGHQESRRPSPYAPTLHPVSIRNALHGFREPYRVESVFLPRLLLLCLRLQGSRMSLVVRALPRVGKGPFGVFLETATQSSQARKENIGIVALESQQQQQFARVATIVADVDNHTTRRDDDDGTTLDEPWLVSSKRQSLARPMDLGRLSSVCECAA